MTATRAAPEIRRAGSRPARPRKLFVNVPVSDLQRSIRFFEALGFTFNPQFTDHTAACMLVGEDAYVMLLTRDKFREFTPRPITDPRAQTGALYSITADSRSDVDALVNAALAAGGARAGEPQDHGFMYLASFYDPDGHHWEVFWMDPNTIQG